MIRILFFTDSFSVGGAQVYLRQLLERLDRTRFEPRVACLDTSGPLHDGFVRMGLEPVEFPVRGGLARPGSLLSFLRAAAWIRRNRFDLVHCWMHYANVFGGLATVLGGRSRLICSLRGLHPSGGAFHPNPSIDRVHHLAVRRADRVIVNAEGLREFARDVEGVAPERIELIPNGVDVERFATNPSLRQRARADLGLTDGERAVTCIGRLIPEKGCHDALEAFLAAAVPRSRLLLAGDGREEPALRRRADEAGAADRVVFLGVREDVPALLAATDVFLFPSHAEGSPNALLEAMAAARPIVAADAVGIRDLARNRREALLAPVGDRAALAKCLRELLGDPANAAALGAAARQRVLTFSLRESVARFEHTYEEVVSERSDRRSPGRSN